MQSTVLRDSGREFHIVGLETLNALSSSSVLVRGMIQSVAIKTGDAMLPSAYDALVYTSLMKPPRPGRSIFTYLHSVSRKNLIVIK